MLTPEQKSWGDNSTQELSSGVTKSLLRKRKKLTMLRWFGLTLVILPFAVLLIYRSLGGSDDTGRTLVVIVVVVGIVITFVANTFFKINQHVLSLQPDQAQASDISDITTKHGIDR